MMMEEPNSREEESSSQVIEGVLGGLKLEGLAVAPLKAGDEEATVVEVADKAPQDKGLEARA